MTPRDFVLRCQRKTKVHFPISFLVTRLSVTLSLGQERDIKIDENDGNNLDKSIMLFYDTLKDFGVEPASKISSPQSSVRFAGSAAHVMNMTSGNIPHLPIAPLLLSHRAVSVEGGGDVIIERKSTRLQSRHTGAEPQAR